jgi:Ferritin-like domain
MSLSRSKLLAGGAALGVFGPTLVGAMLQEAQAATPSDIQLLNGAIELENAGIKAYTDAFSLNLLSPPVLAIAKGFRSDHQAHAAALTAAVKAAGGTPTTATAKLEYPSLKSEAEILAFAEKVERLAATSYLTDIGKLSNPALAKTMASILGVETTHVATLAAALKQGPPYPGFVS